MLEIDAVCGADAAAMAFSRTASGRRYRAGRRCRRSTRRRARLSRSARADRGMACSASLRGSSRDRVSVRSRQGAAALGHLVDGLGLLHGQGAGCRRRRRARSRRPGRPGSRSRRRGCRTPRTGHRPAAGRDDGLIIRTAPARRRRRRYGGARRRRGGDLAVGDGALQGAAGGGPVLDTAPARAAQAAADHGDAFVAHEIFGEVGVGGPDVAQAVEHPPAAEQLGLQPVATGAHLQAVVDQQLHRIGPVAAARVGPRPCPLGQQEVVHAADARCADRAGTGPRSCPGWWSA